MIQRRWQHANGRPIDEFTAQHWAFRFQYNCTHEFIGWASLTYRERRQPCRPTQSRLDEFIRRWSDLEPRTADTKPVRLQTT
jgi:hypothetical protein